MENKEISVREIPKYLEAQIRGIQYQNIHAKMKCKCVGKANHYNHWRSAYSMDLYNLYSILSYYLKDQVSYDKFVKFVYRNSSGYIDIDDTGFEANQDMLDEYLVDLYYRLIEYTDKLKLLDRCTLYNFIEFISPK
jgi:hypothetical protein